jgi:ubiquinone/menaquinone biosynthesis C-methylase UbiE
VVAVEPLPHLRRLALSKAARVPIPISVVHGVAEHLPADTETFDAAVVSMVLCSVSEQQSALKEIYRVLRPGGALHVFERTSGNTWATGFKERLNVCNDHGVDGYRGR